MLRKVARPVVLLAEVHTGVSSDSKTNVSSTQAVHLCSDLQSFAFGASMISQTFHGEHHQQYHWHLVIYESSLSSP